MITENIDWEDFDILMGLWAVDAWESGNLELAKEFLDM